jgi:hypothetical protein
MRVFRFDSVSRRWRGRPVRAVAFFAAVLALPAGAALSAAAVPMLAAQLQSPDSSRSIVGRSVTLGSRQARLRVDFDRGPALEVGIGNGRVEINNEVAGTLPADATLFEEWSALLTDLAALDDADFAAGLIEWSPNAQAEAEVFDLAQQVDEALETQLARAIVPAAPEAAALEGAAREAAAVADANEVGGDADAAEVAAVTAANPQANEDRDGRPRVRVSVDLDESSWSFRRPFRRALQGLGGLFSRALNLLLLSLLAAAVLHFVPRNFERVAETARHAPGQALAVGAAGLFLFLPAWILGGLALILTIIGIPLVLLWIPLFPAVTVAALGFGYLALAHNVGSWAVRQNLPWTDRMRLSNPLTLSIGGLVLLASGFLVADALKLLPFTGAIELLMTGTASVLNGVALLIGLGAVIMTRGGRRHSVAGAEPFHSYRDFSEDAAVDTDPLDADPVDADRADLADDATTPDEGTSHG